MKKETLQQIFKRTVTKKLLDVVFVKPEEAEKLFNRPIKPFKSPTLVSPEQQLLSVKDSFGIKVQSVALPKEHQLYTLKTEEQFLDWMGNTIHSQHTAYYQMTKKYDGDAEHLGWSNNKTQNQRYLEWYGR